MAERKSDPQYRYIYPPQTAYDNFQDLVRKRGGYWEAIKALGQAFAEEKAHEFAGGISAPGDAFSGRMDPLSPEGMARVGALSGLLTPGPLATGPAHIAPGALSAAGWHKGLINDLEALVAKPQAKPKVKEASPMADLYAALDKLDAKIQAQGQPKPPAPHTPQWYKETGVTPAAPAKGDKAQGEWTKTGPAKGSNPGGTYNDPSGVPHYVKFYKDDAQARSEWLAGKTLDALGIKHLNPEVRAVDGKLGVATKWNADLEPLSKADFEKLTPKQEDQLAKMYLGAVLTKNWDVVGLGFDNIMRNKKTGDLVQVDLGGSFKHRAQGEVKEYGHDTKELESLLDPKYPAGQVFSKLFEKNPESLVKAKEALFNAALPLEELHKHFKSNGAEDIYNTLIRRSDNIYNELGKEPTLPNKADWQKQNLTKGSEGFEPFAYNKGVLSNPLANKAILEHSDPASHKYVHDILEHMHNTGDSLGQADNAILQKMIDKGDFMVSNNHDKALHYLQNFTDKYGPIDFAKPDPKGWDKVEAKAPDSPPNLEQIKKDLGLTGDVGYFHPHNAHASSHPAAEDFPKDFGSMPAKGFVHELLEMHKNDPVTWDEHFDNLVPFIEKKDFPHLAAAKEHLEKWEEANGPVQFEQPKYVHPHNAFLSDHPAYKDTPNNEYAKIINLIAEGGVKSSADAVAKMFVDGKISKEHAMELAPVAQQMDKWAAQHGGWNFEPNPEAKPEFGPAKPAKGSSTTKAIEQGLTPFEWRLHAPESIMQAPPELAALLSDQERVIRALDLGHNLTIPLFGGKSKFVGTKVDPKFWDDKEEKAFFLAGKDPFAKLIALNEYGHGDPSKVHTFTSNAKNPLMLDWEDAFDSAHYVPYKMAKAINIARERGADMLMLKNMSDLGSYKHGLQTQFAILDPKILRWPSAEYNPLMADSPDLLHAGGLPIPLFPEWGQEDEGQSPSRRIIDIAR